MKEINEQFFSRATFLLCRHLELPAFLVECLEMMKKVCPVDKIILCLVHSEDLRFETVALADGEGGRELSDRIEVTVDTIKAVQAIGPPTQIFKRASLAAPARPLIEGQLLPGDSAVVTTRLVLGEEAVGLLYFGAESGQEFVREQGKLFAGFRQPLSLGINNCLKYKKLRERTRTLGADVNFLGQHQSVFGGTEIIGSEMGLSLAVSEARQAAAADFPVVITGEFGSGRTFLAGLIHHLSRRQKRLFIEIDLGRIPEDQVERHLFGWEVKGVKVPTDTTLGLFDRAAGGTACIRGFESLSPEKKQLLWKVVREKTFTRKGGSELVPCDVQFIFLGVSDWRPESFAVLEQTVSMIEVPPLRERQEDIPRLAAYFIERMCRRMNRRPIPQLAKESLDWCLAYAWPGNVMELQVVLERAVIFADEEEVVIPDAFSPKEPDNPPELAESEMLNLDSAIRRHIIKVMRRTQGKVGGEDGAAALMGINPSTLRKRMRKLKIPFGRKIDYQHLEIEEQ